VAAGLTVRHLRDQIREGITLALGAGGWVESRHSPEMFGSDTRDQRHLSFSVGLPGTDPASLDRQSTHGGAATRFTFATTSVVVRWGFRLRSDGESLDYSLALTAEADLVAALLAIDRSSGMVLRLVSLRRSVVAVLEEGSLLEGQVGLEALHRLPLV
jgi:hypothetical protein